MVVSAFESPSALKIALSAVIVILSSATSAVAGVKVT